MGIKKKLKKIFTIILCGFTLPAVADFAVICDDPPRPPYGNAQTARFRHALEGGPLTPEEAAELARYLPEKEYDRYYLRVRINASTLVLNNIRNRSIGINQPGVVVNRRAIKNQSGLEFALGYIWSKDFRGDIEYLANKNLNFTSNPGITGIGVTPGQLAVSVKNNTLLANVYYEFNNVGLGRLKPYLTAGLGVAVNSVTSTLTTPGGLSGSRTVQTGNLAYALGLGMRLGIYTRWYLDLSYRYIGLGTINIQPLHTSNYRLQGNYGMNAVSIGFILLL